MLHTNIHSKLSAFTRSKTEKLNTENRPKNKYTSILSNGDPGAELPKL